MPMLGSGLIAVNAQGCQVSGIALRLGAVTACALYTVLTRRLLLDDGSLVVVLGQQVLAFVLVLLALVVGVIAGWYATSTAMDAATLGWRPRLVSSTTHSRTSGTSRRCVRCQRRGGLGAAAHPSRSNDQALTAGSRSGTSSRRSLATCLEGPAMHSARFVADAAHGCVVRAATNVCGQYT